ncbi:MAG: asparagine synthetase B, partial [Bacteroidetes bacterium]|nr:asparagine synthetase B [Bacteroidota bacterium]
MRILFTLFLLSFTIQASKATQILVPMDQQQKNHLKAYGLAYWTLENQIVIEWLLNYRGG